MSHGDLKIHSQDVILATTTTTAAALRKENNVSGCVQHFLRVSTSA